MTEGLDGLRERFAEYRELGARFSKWRATYSIGDGRPSEYCVWVNAHALARYAALAQEAGIVPIVEPEVLMDGDHSIDDSAKASGRALQALYTELHDQRIDLRGTILKPNMVLSGYAASERAGIDEVAERTLEVLLPSCAGGRPGDLLPVRRPDGRGRDRPPERDGPARAASVGALVLVRPRAAGTGACRLGRTGRERRGRSGRVLQAREAERRRARRGVLGRPGVTEPLAAIGVEGLTVVRGGASVLDGLSLEVPAGKVTGLLGPSGGGKSTLLRSIVGVQQVAAGTVDRARRAGGLAGLRRAGRLPDAVAVRLRRPLGAREPRATSRGCTRRRPRAAATS